MDLKTITKILDTQESLFRTLLDSNKSPIDGDALKAKLTLHHINLVIIAGNRYPQSSTSISDPFDSSSTSNSTTNKQKRGRGRPKGHTTYRSLTPDQVLTTPKGRSMAYSRDMRPAGASRLFGRKKGVAVPIIDLVDDDDSAGSPAEESDSDGMFISPNSNSSKPSTRKSRRFSSRTEKEAERKRGAGKGLGLGMSGMGARKETVEEREEAEIDAAGFEGGKDGAGNDREMEDLIQYADDEEEEGEVEGESPSKRRRSL